MRYASPVLRDRYGVEHPLDDVLDADDPGDAAILVYIDPGPKGIRSDMTGIDRAAQHFIGRTADIAVRAGAVYDGIERARALLAAPWRPFEAEAIPVDADAVNTSGGMRLYDIGGTNVGIDLRGRFAFAPARNVRAKPAPLRRSS